MSEHRLGPWWPVAGIALIGLLIVIVGDRFLVGGIVMSLGFLLAAVRRRMLPDLNAGGLFIRSKRTDVISYVALSVNVAMVFLLVWRHLSVPVYVAVNAVLLVLGGYALYRRLPWDE